MGAVVFCVTFIRSLAALFFVGCLRGINCSTFDPRKVRDCLFV